MSARAILDLYRAGHRTQAIELARCLGGEVERLVLAMHRAQWICDEIEDYAEQAWGCSWETLAESYDWWDNGNPSPGVPICALLRDGRDYWGDEYSTAAGDLLALEAA